MRYFVQSRCLGAAESDLVVAKVQKSRNRFAWRHPAGLDVGRQVFVLPLRIGWVLAGKLRAEQRPIFPEFSSVS